jgi:iron complex transport system substrate-binding protein
MRTFILLIAGCLGLGTAAYAQAEADAHRIVTLGGSVTETVYALGAGDQVVGVDDSSVYPADATQQPSVGYYRQLPAEGVLSLDPTLVLALEGTGPPAILDQLRSAGVRVERIPDAPSIEGTKAKIRRIAALLGRTAEGEALLRQMDQALAEARALRQQATTTPRVLFVYARGTGTMNVAGRGSSGEAMIELAGGQNAITGFEGYKPMTAEAVVAANPDVLLLLSRGLDSLGGIDGLLKQPGIALTQAGQERRIVAMDDLLFLGFGPRLGTAVKQLTAKLHPELDTPPAVTTQ